MRQLSLTFGLGEPEDMIPFTTDADGSPVRSESDKEFVALADRLHNEDTVFTRFAFTESATRTLESGTMAERHLFGNMIDNGLSTWSIEYEHDKVFTH